MKVEFEDRVKETTTGTGTGNKTLAGAVVGFQSFADALPAGGYFCYEIHAVDSGGSPSGDWEVGVGYLSSGALASVKVLSSSNAGAAVNFSAGTKVVSMTAPASFCGSLRLEEVITIYASPATGMDYYDGLSVSRPLDTLQAAVDMAVAVCSVGVNVTIELLDNSSVGVSLPGFDRVGASQINIRGYNYGSTISIGGAINAENAGNGWKISYLTIGGGASCLIVGKDSFLEIGSSVTFGQTTGSQIVVRDGGRLYAVGGYHIAGGSTGGAHLDVDAAGYAAIGGSINFDADCNFAQGFARCVRGGGYIDAANAVFLLNAHTITGQRYNVNGNGVVWTAGSGATFLPGDAAGAETNGGKYL